ncbi:MAG: BrnT family toxin [bacterium]
MQFEWDKEKIKKNNKKHKVSLDEAMTVFYDPLSATFDDPDHSDDEQRLITIGYSSHGRLLVVSHTERGKAIRIISARLANIQERKRHEN